MEQIALKSRLSIYSRVYIAYQMGTLCQISHRLHIKQINLFCPIDELSDSEAAPMSQFIVAFGDQLLVVDDDLVIAAAATAAFAVDSQIFYQGVDAETFALEPLNEDAQE